MPFRSPIICEKAVRLYSHLVTSSGEGTASETELKFTATKDLTLVGEAASADHTAAANYQQEINAIIIEDKDCLPEQVFNADKTGLYWKRMPNRTFISKAAQDSLTLLLCENTAGTCMIKPMLLYRSQNPQALAENIKGTWVTAKIFVDWFKNFVKEVEKQPRCTKFANTNVEVVFLPPNTISLIQPLDQGIIAAFKCYYTRSTHSRIMNMMTKDPTLLVLQCWKNYDIAECITVIKESLDECTLMQNFQGFPAIDIEVMRIVGAAQQLKGEGLEDMQPHKVQELILSQCSANVNETESPYPMLTIQNISKAMFLASQLSDYYIN
ncbi:hypothetical protein PR048_010637 [Dryococelus australis]|uniref:DDE-1 domain-containing protein n=1 Tax=Dryococelus australis TaxID=614101 RepID=A0ABQ9I399_9NEOP|nr:hypothetical protein PR048_010637 [Dryococelus australis]